MKRFGIVGAIVIVMLAVATARMGTADAYLQFQRAWQKIYIGEEETEVQRALRAEMDDVSKCNVCHDPRPGEDGKKSKKNRNPYGEALNELLDKDDKKDEEKIIEALREVESMQAEDGEESYGERLEAGHLPFRYEDE